MSEAAVVPSRSRIGVWPIVVVIAIEAALVVTRSAGVLIASGFIGGIPWLVFVATFGAWSLYYIALRKSSPTRVTSILYLSPPVMMIWAWIMFDEPLTWAMAFGLLVSLVGIVLVARARTGVAA